MNLNLKEVFRAAAAAALLTSQFDIAKASPPPPINPSTPSDCQPFGGDDTCNIDPDNSFFFEKGRLGGGVAENERVTIFDFFSQ